MRINVTIPLNDSFLHDSLQAEQGYGISISTLCLFIPYIIARCQVCQFSDQLFSKVGEEIQRAGCESLPWRFVVSAHHCRSIL